MGSTSSWAPPFDHSNRVEEKRGTKATVSNHSKCCGIVTAYVLVEGLSRRAIATRRLKGFDRDKAHERSYTSSAPYDEGKSLRLAVFGTVGVSITKRLNSPAWLSKSCFLP